jgi:hypothetical protein
MQPSSLLTSRAITIGKPAVRVRIVDEVNRCLLVVSKLKRVKSLVVCLVISRVISNCLVSVLTEKKGDKKVKMS